MKFKRLRIKNYRGVEESAVDFADSGITLIQGPNEIGKTSLAESIHMLFQHKASSNRQEVRDIKPVHRDAGAEVELEAESGPFHFVYRKQFHKAKSTELDILAPRPENFTDDEAHEQANKILTETLDKPLWDALIVRQGDMIEQPDLSGKAALMKALDGEADGAGQDRRAEGLFERIEAEYARHYQKNGRESAELAGAAAALEQAREREEDCRSRLEGLEKKSERCALLKRREAELHRQISEKKIDFEKNRLLADEIDTLEKELAAAQLERKTAEAAAIEAEQNARERRRLVDALKTAEDECAEIEAEHAALEPARQEALLRFDSAKEVFARAREAGQAADAALALARADCDHHNDILHLEMMRERKERLDSAGELRENASRDAADRRVDEKLVAEIREAELAVTGLRARLEAESPKVVVRSLGEGEAVIAGETVNLGNGDTVEHSVAGRLVVAVPGRLEVTVNAGDGPGDLARRLDDGRERLEALCRRGGVADSAAAMAALEKQRRARAALDDINRIERENLRDLSREDFTARLAELEFKVADYPQTRAQLHLPPENLDAARTLLAEIERTRAETASRLERETGVYAVREREWEDAAARLRDKRIALSLAAKRREQAESALAASRGANGDDALLDEKLTAAKEAVDRAAEKAERLEGSLREKNPDKVRAMASALSGALASMDTQVREVERELAALSTELGIRGEEGLFDEWQAAGLEAEDKAKRLAAMRSRAEAARLLYEVMRGEREKARRNYIEPLKNKIEELGRVVWNSTFRVEMDEGDLSIASRTLDGVTVPFASLSGGAREQLSLIFRAACAIIVSSHSGMPLILDDALGYTDTERLLLMGAVLAKAAEQCQVIIFTCVPERYGNIGNAKVIQLS